MKFVPYDKMSKKQQSEYNHSKRTAWDCYPVTKIVPSKKVYNRKKVSYD